MVERGLQRVVGVDWSGDKGPGQRRKIWAGVWTASTGRVTLEGGRTREELIAWLVEMSRETPRMVVGFDFTFSYPAWFLKELGIRNLCSLRISKMLVRSVTCLDTNLLFTTMSSV